MNDGIEFEHDNTTAEFWIDDGELCVVAQHKYTDGHMAVMTLEQARKLRDWLAYNI